mgnify:CR=1 FL=1
MSKTVVLYQSKYGSAKRYAQWLAEELSCDLIETKKAKIEEVVKYDVIILGGGVYASGIAGSSFLRKHYARLREKKIVVFAVGASPHDEKVMNIIRERNLKGELAGIPCFYFRGGWNEEKMSWLDRFLCNMLKKAVAKKDPATLEVWEAALLEASGSVCDWTDKAQLQPLLEHLRNLN